MIGAKISVGLSLLRYTPVTKQTYRWITHYHPHQCRHGHCVWPHSNVPVQPSAILLEASPRRNRYLYQHGHYNCIHIRGVRHLRGLQLELRYPSSLPHQGIEHEPERKDRANSDPEYGLHVGAKAFPNITLKIRRIEV